VNDLCINKKQIEKYKGESVMKVVLNENVKGLGKKLEEVNVSEGYARNYLFPKKLATLADIKSVSEAEAKKAAIKFKHSVEIQKAEELKEKIESKELDFKIKTGDNGKTFGSITPKEIVEEIKKQIDIDIDKKKIILGNNIKAEGVYTVKIKIFENIAANVKIKVIGG